MSNVNTLDRVAILSRTRALKMASSTHAYVRGNTVKFYEWLAESRAADKLPVGPPVWICGDCHLGNLGPLADADGHVDIQIRDLDQTVIGNPAHDLIRLGLSLATAARSSDLPGVTTARMIEEMVVGYDEALRDGYRKPREAQGDIRGVHDIMQSALRRRWKNLAQDRIGDTTPVIPRGSKFWDLTNAERGQLDALIESDDVRALVTALRKRDNDAKIRLLDAAYWVKGCSSLGRLRYAALVRVGGKKSTDICFLDIKEATAAAAPRAPDAVMPRDHAERV